MNKLKKIMKISHDHFWTPPILKYCKIAFRNTCCFCLSTNQKNNVHFKKSEFRKKIVIFVLGTKQTLCALDCVVKGQVDKK